MAGDLKLIVDQANRCKKIISGLLNFARQSRVVRQPTDLVGLVDGHAAHHADRREHHGAVESTMADPVAEVDADQMVQVLTNLVSNAQQAMPDGGALIIRLSDTPDEVSFMVTDTGVGHSRARTWTSSSTRSSRPSRWARAPASAWPSPTASSRCTAARSRSSRTPIPAAGPTETTFIVTLPRHEL